MLASDLTSVLEKGVIYDGGIKCPKTNPHSKGFSLGYHGSQSGGTTTKSMHLRAKWCLAEVTIILNISPLIKSVAAISHLPYEIIY
jgi:hypothetical protein